jgi:hypothetical protein
MPTRTVPLTATEKYVLMPPSISKLNTSSHLFSFTKVNRASQERDTNIDVPLQETDLLYYSATNDKKNKYHSATITCLVLEDSGRK